MVGIYKITSPSNKVYIGQSWDIRGRWYSHGHSKHTPFLYNSIKKYGKENHVFNVIHELPIDVSQYILDEYEKLYIQQYKSVGFFVMNMKSGGSNGKHSEKTKAELSNSVKKWWQDKYKSNKTVNTILSYQDVLDIRLSIMNGETVLSKLSNKYNVSLACISSIVKMKTHKNIVIDGYEPFIKKDFSKTKCGKYSFSRVVSNETKVKLSESLLKSKNIKRGENNLNSKLTNTQVREIRDTYKNGGISARKIAKLYGVSHSVILDIVNYKKWKSI